MRAFNALLREALDVRAVLSLFGVAALVGPLIAMLPGHNTGSGAAGPGNASDPA